MIEPVTQENLAEILPLIRKYQEFYKVSDINDERNRAFFSQFGPDNAAGCQFSYRSHDQVLGFATVYFSYASTIASKVAILNDLYCLPEARGKGIGRALLQYCHAYAGRKGAARLQWMSAPDNEVAHGLYASVGAQKSTWFFYSKNI